MITLIGSNSVNISSCIKPNGTVNNVLDETEKDVKRLTKQYYVIISAVTNDVDLYMNDQSFIASLMEEKVKELVNTSFIVAALPYMYDEPFLKNKIKRINKQMDRFCKKYIQINYLYPNNINQYDYTKYDLPYISIQLVPKRKCSLYNFINYPKCRMFKQQFS